MKTAFVLGGGGVLGAYEVGMLRALAEAGIRLRACAAWAGIEERATAAIDGSQRHVYVSVNCPDPSRIAAALRRADDRGVPCDVLHFGEPIADLRHGRMVGHGSTRGVVYPPPPGLTPPHFVPPRQRRNSNMLSSAR